MPSTLRLTIENSNTQMHAPWQQSTQENQKARAGVFSCQSTDDAARAQALGISWLVAVKKLRTFCSSLQFLPGRLPAATTSITSKVRGQEVKSVN